MLGLLIPILASAIYTNAFTTLLDRWLASQVPPRPLLASLSPAPVAVIPGRGPQIAQATTVLAASALRRGTVSAIYVSGDNRSTADLLVRLGVPLSQLAGDSCARTTWENATLTASWLRQHHPRSPVLLITDPWQLPRASHAFRRQGLTVIPQPALPLLTQKFQNRLALRETAATILYTLLGRM